MNVENISTRHLNISSTQKPEPMVKASRGDVLPAENVINEKVMKAILYMGIRGKIVLPKESHRVDTFA